MDDEQLPHPGTTGPTNPAAAGPSDTTPEDTSAAPTAADLQENLNQKQAEALIALLHEPTLARVAAQVGVNERTIRRWLEDPTFKKAYLLARRESFGHAVGLLQRYAPVAVNTLVKIMTSDQTPPGVKVTAAATLLKFGREGIELDDMAQRIELLERTADVTAKWQGHP